MGKIFNLSPLVFLQFSTKVGSIKNGLDILNRPQSSNRVAKLLRSSKKWFVGRLVLSTIYPIWDCKSKDFIEISKKSLQVI